MCHGCGDGFRSVFIHVAAGLGAMGFGTAGNVVAVVALVLIGFILIAMCLAE